METQERIDKELKPILPSACSELGIPFYFIEDIAVREHTDGLEPCSYCIPISDGDGRTARVRIELDDKLTGRFDTQWHLFHGLYNARRHYRDMENPSTKPYPHFMADCYAWSRMAKRVLLRR